MTESRSKKAVVNTISGFAYEFVSVICGLIVSKLLLYYYGSAYNGLISSISQFISCISLMKAGIGGVTRAALYKPLSENNSLEISEIIISTEKFMRKIALIFTGAVLVFAAVYPFLVSEFSWSFSFTLILIISISTFIQYFFSITYQMLLNADQKQHVCSIAQIVSTIVNTLLTIVFIRNGASIHFVKLASTVAFALNPLIIYLYVHMNYDINHSVIPSHDRIKQRWDAVGHELANFVNNNTDIIVLTFFSNIKLVSVYTVYSYVTTAIHKIVVNFVTSFGSAFGNMYARKEIELMHKNLGVFELIIFSISTVVYSVTFTMIRPFVLIYTQGVTDISYDRPVFGMLITLAGAFTCFRIPYYTITTALGHYKQTRNGAFAEAVINIVVSVIFVIKFNLVGVAIGTLCAAVFRSTQYAIYLGRKILPRSNFIFIKHVFVSLTVMAVTYIFGKRFADSSITVEKWIFAAALIFIFSAFLTAVTDLIFWRKEALMFFAKVKGMLVHNR